MRKEIIVMVWAAACAMVMTFSSCSEEPTVEPDNMDVDASGVAMSMAQKAVATKTADFSDDLFIMTSQLKGDENFVISPLGASMTLSMIANGAAGNTQKEILDAMGIEEGDIACLNSLHRTLLDKLATGSLCDIKIGNSFWYNPDMLPNVNLDYCNTLTDSYDASIFSFTEDKFIPAANEWFTKQIGFVPNDFLKFEEIKDAGVVFFSTLDFSGIWKKVGGLPTQPMTFNNADGTKKDVVSLKYDSCEKAWSTGYCYIVDIPYRGFDCFFRIIYPYEGVSVDECVSQYQDFLADPRNKHYWMFGVEGLSFNTYFPKLEVESKVDLIPMLKKMGVKDLFDEDNCDLTNIAQGAEGYIDVFKQYTKFKLDEKGTVAKSVTHGSGPLGSAVVHPIPKNLKIERPFAFEIYEESTGMPLIQGRINNL